MKDMSVGERLRQQRKRAQLSLGQVAEYEGVSKTYLSSLERGANDPNVWHLLVRLARRYHTSADYLLGLNDSPPPTAEDQPLHTEIRQLWDELDDEQRRLVLDTMRMLAKVRTPHIIGGEEEEDKK